MTAWLLLVLGVLVLALALTASWSVSRARRLDRLHVRLDAARGGLTAALDRRVEVAIRAAAAVPGPPELASVARAARIAAAGPREPTENALTRRLAALDRHRLDDDLFAELLDAEQLVILARRVHNDAVRDTLALRSRRLVRWLRLAGTASEPVYFDIADPEPGTAVARVRDAGSTGRVGRLT